MSRYVLLILPVCTLLLIGCANPIDDFDKNEVSSTPLNHQIQNRTLGIAISGGGLRSSAYSFGALRTLHKQGKLYEVDIFSTVSGGGYTGYELFANEMFANELCTDPSSYECTRSIQFGDATFSDNVFSERAYAQYYTANFVEYLSWDAISTIFPFYTLIDLYDKKIMRKYGYNDKGRPTRIRISDFNDTTNIAGLPELIVNTTFLEPWPVDFSQDIYEFTFTGAGSDARGFHPYTDGKGPELSKLVAISGAAFKPLLKQKIKDPTIHSDDFLVLSDGGHSENLGAFSLIKRGVCNVVIIDAEHDPDYKFGAYTLLKERLEYWGYNIEVKDIDKLVNTTNRNLRLKSPVMFGKTTAPNGDIQNIYYLKAMNSEYVKEFYTEEMVSKGKTIANKNIAILENNLDENHQWDSKNLSNIKMDYDSLFAYHLDSYPGILNSLWHVKLSNALDSNFAKLEFPQYSTMDQSFAINQYFAFVSLGYFSAKVFEEIELTKNCENNMNQLDKNTN